jgi:colicin import membrane protein
MRTIPFLLLMLLVGAAAAQQPDGPPPDDRAEKLERARRLHDEANAIRAEADRRHSAAQAACWEKFLVNSCLADAKDAQRSETVKARELDKQGRDLEREVKRRDIAEHEAKRIEEAPAKEAAAAARAEKSRKAAEEAQRRVESKQAGAAASEAK